MQSRVQPYGQTCGLKRSREKSNDYCDIEFVSREDAQDAIQNCTIDKIDFKWAPEDIYKKKAKGPAIASFQSPGFDYDIYSQEPSLPLPSNNPNITKWVLPPKLDPADAQEPAKYYAPRRTQPPAGPSPHPPFKNEEDWPGLPTYDIPSEYNIP